MATNLDGLTVSVEDQVQSANDLVNNTLVGGITGTLAGLPTPAQLSLMAGNPFGADLQSPPGGASNAFNAASPSLVGLASPSASINLGLLGLNQLEHRGLLTHSASAFPQQNSYSQNNGNHTMAMAAACAAAATSAAMVSANAVACANTATNGQSGAKAIGPAGSSSSVTSFPPSAQPAIITNLQHAITNDSAVLPNEDNKIRVKHIGHQQGNQECKKKYLSTEDFYRLNDWIRMRLSEPKVILGELESEQMRIFYRTPNPDTKLKAAVIMIVDTLIDLNLPMELFHSLSCLFRNFCIKTLWKDYFRKLQHELIAEQGFLPIESEWLIDKIWNNYRLPFVKKNKSKIFGIFKNKTFWSELTYEFNMAFPKRMRNVVAVRNKIKGLLNYPPARFRDRLLHLKKERASKLVLDIDTTGPKWEPLVEESIPKLKTKVKGRAGKVKAGKGAKQPDHHHQLLPSMDMMHQLTLHQQHQLLVAQSKKGTIANPPMLDLDETDKIENSKMMNADLPTLEEDIKSFILSNDFFGSLSPHKNPNVIIDGIQKTRTRKGNLKAVPNALASSTALKAHGALAPPPHLAQSEGPVKPKGSKSKAKQGGSTASSSSSSSNKQPNKGKKAQAAKAGAKAAAGAGGSKKRVRTGRTAKRADCLYEENDAFEQDEDAADLNNLPNKKRRGSAGGQTITVDTALKAMLGESSGVTPGSTKSLRGTSTGLTPAHRFLRPTSGRRSARGNFSAYNSGAIDDERLGDCVWAVLKSRGWVYTKGRDSENLYYIAPDAVSTQQSQVDGVNRFACRKALVDYVEMHEPDMFREAMEMAIVQLPVSSPHFGAFGSIGALTM